MCKYECAQYINDIGLSHLGSSIPLILPSCCGLQLFHLGYERFLISGLLGGLAMSR